MLVIELTISAEEGVNGDGMQAGTHNWQTSARRLTQFTIYPLEVGIGY